jgi:hypothetical protein
VYRYLRHGAVRYHAETWGNGGGWMARQWASSAHHGISVHSKCLSIKCNYVCCPQLMPAHTITPLSACQLHAPSKLEINKLLCLWNISGIFYFSSRNMEPPFTCWVYILFSVYSKSVWK